VTLVLKLEAGQASLLRRLQFPDRERACIPVFSSMLRTGSPLERV